MKLALSGAAAFGLALSFASPAQAQIVGSASLATHRDCSAFPATNNCLNQRSKTVSYGGGVGFGGTNYLNVGGDNTAWSNVSFGNLDLPVIKAYSSASGNTRMNINVFGFQSFVYNGANATAFSISGNLHIVNSSSNPTDGTLPGGAIYSNYLGIWDPSILNGLTTAQELISSLFYADCDTPGVLAVASGGGNLSGGEASFGLTTTACGGGALMIAPGQEVLVVAGLQLPVNRGGFADATRTFTTSLGDDLTSEQKDTLVSNLASAISQGANVSVPEAPTWAMLIFGFFGLGAAVRRQRHAPLAAN